MDGNKIFKCEKKAIINSYSKDGLSVLQIALKLNIAKSTVWDAINRFRKNNCRNNDKPRSGRPRKTTFAEEKSIVLMSKRDRRKTAPEIQSNFNCCHESQISVNTVKRRLRSVGLNGRVAKQKPFLSRVNKLKRLQWAREHKNWTIDDFKKVLWSEV